MFRDAKSAAETLIAELRLVPSSREVSLAITKVQEALHWIQAAQETEALKAPRQG